MEPLLLTDQDEKGAILWIANKSLPEANLDGYFIYKHDTRLSSLRRPASEIMPISILSGAASRGRWKTTGKSAEGAYQLGREQDPELNQGGLNPVLAPSPEPRPSATSGLFV